MMCVTCKEPLIYKYLLSSGITWTKNYSIYILEYNKHQYITYVTFMVR